MSWIFSPFGGYGGFGFGGGRFGGSHYFDDDRIDRSSFNDTSAAADRRLNECKSFVRGQDFSDENEHRIVSFDPNKDHLVNANWKKLVKWLAALPVPLVAVRVKATPQQMHNLKITRKAAWFVSVARTRADASAAAKASAAQANVPKSTAAATAAAASSSSSSSSSAMNIAAQPMSASSVAKASTKVVKKPQMTTNGTAKPKRSPSAYILFCTDKRSEVQKKYPEASFGDLGKLMGHLWGSMDAKAKAPYEQLALTKKNEQQS